MLNVNYRSTENIVQSAERLIHKNKVRFQKEIQSNRKKGKNVDIRKFKNQGEEISYVIKQIRNALKNGRRPQDIAILVRNNSQVPLLQTALQNNMIGSRIKKQQNPVYNGFIIKDIMAYIYAAKKNKDLYLNENEELIYILNKPTRLISRESIVKSKMTFQRLKEEYAHNSEIFNHIENLQFHLQMIDRLNPYAAINYIRKGAGYEEYLRQYSKEHKIKPEALIKQLEQIQTDAYRFYNDESWIRFVREQQEFSGKVSDGVRILTMHGAKGLEFPVVIILDANQGIIPSKRIIRENEYEEERRVFYVAMTRAKDELYIYGIMESLGNPMEMSMFVSDIIDN